MKPKNLLILAAVVLAVAAYVFFIERGRPTTEELQQGADKVFPDLERDRVTALGIERDGSTLRLDKEGDAWRLLEPIAYPADEATVSSTIGSLLSLKAERRLEGEGLDPAAYGLEPPAATVTLGLADGSELRLEVGNELPLGSTRALRRVDSSEILIAPGWFMSDLERGLADWRSHEVVNLQSDEVAAITVEAGADTIRALRSGEQWRLESPLQDLADRDHLQGLLSDLGAMRIAEFLDGSAAPEELGLATPEYRLSILRSDGGAPIRIELGATRERDGATEVACRRGDELFWAADRVRTRLAKAPVLWRSRKVWPLDTWEIDKLRLSNPGDGAAELEKVDFEWRFVGGGGADQARVSDRLTALAGLEATDYDLMIGLSAEMGRAEIGLGTGEDGGEPESLSFAFFEPLSEGGRALVTVSGREGAMGVDAATARRIVGDLAGLRAAPAEPSGDPSGAGGE